MKIVNFNAVLAGLVVSVNAAALPIAGMGTWERTLKPRDINHDGTVDAYYDRSQNITWLADAALSITQGSPDGGRMEWHAAMDWAANLDIYGESDWRLYKTFPIASHGRCTYTDTGNGKDCGFGVSAWSSELAHLYYITLGNTGIKDVGFDYDIANSGPFRNLDNRHYWSETDQIGRGDRAWNFGGDKDLRGAYQNIGTKYAPIGRHHVWAVHDGDIPMAAIPEPSTYVQLLIGIGFLGMAFKRQLRHSL